MEKSRQATWDGNEAAACLAHLCHEVIAITPSPLGSYLRSSGT
jgi:hypothetical protein